MKCGKCQNPMIFLLQIYAEDPNENNDPKCFHRTLFVFLCPKAECHKDENTLSFKVFRNQLPRENEFFSYQSPVEQEDWEPNRNVSKYIQTCRICGCRGDKTCVNCKQVHYCSRDHQVQDWSLQHKKECKNEAFRYEYSENEEIKPGGLILPQFEIIVQGDDEEVSDESDTDEPDVQKEIQKIKELEQGSELKINGSDLAQFSTEEEVIKDKNFKRFLKTVQCDSRQIIRYHRKETPLWVSTEHLPNENDIPNCENCGDKRVFEFQIMPQLLSVLKLDKSMKEDSIDWGTLVIYTCEQSCTAKPYQPEFIWKQSMP